MMQNLRHFSFPCNIPQRARRSSVIQSGRMPSLPTVKTHPLFSLHYSKSAVCTFRRKPSQASPAVKHLCRTTGFLYATAAGGAWSPEIYGLPCKIAVATNNLLFVRSYNNPRVCCGGKYYARKAGRYGTELECREVVKSLKA